MTAPAAAARRDYMRSADRRSQIVDVTIELMAERGLAEVSIRDVATAAGVPFSSITYHFGTREELLRAVMESMIEKFCERMVAAAADSRPEDVLESYLAEISSGTGYGPGHHMLLLEFTLYAARRPDTGLARRQYESYEEAGSRVIDSLCAQTRTSFQGDRAPVVRLLVALLEGATLQQLAAGEPEGARPLLEHLGEVIGPHLVPTASDPPNQKGDGA
ncbi:MAG TPA: TetR/AcrR family transcriptional regulator [Solirubrobacterales bacterium]